jgi:hypothetical protein
VIVAPKATSVFFIMGRRRLDHSDFLEGAVRRVRRSVAD